MNTSRHPDTSCCDAHVGCSGGIYPTIWVPLGMEGLFNTVLPFPLDTTLLPLVAVPEAAGVCYIIIPCMKCKPN